MKKFKVYVKSETLLYAGRHFTQGKELLPCPSFETAKELEKSNLVILEEEAPVVKKPVKEEKAAKVEPTPEKKAEKKEVEKPAKKPAVKKAAKKPVKKTTKKPVKKTAKKAN